MKITEAPPLSMDLRLLDVSFQVRVDVSSGLDRLEVLYAAPEFRHPAGTETIAARFHLDETSGADRWVDDGRGATRLGPAADAGLQLHDWVFGRFLDSSRDFHLVHAAALAYRGNALLVVGDSMAGKTTLAVLLTALGLEYYSDDVAPLHRRERKVYPFRRAAGVRLPGGRRGYGVPGAYGREGGIAPAPPPCAPAWVFVLDWSASSGRTRIDATVQQVDPREAALEVLRHTLNRRPQGALYRLHGEHPHLKMYVEILASLEGAACFRLLPGTPESTVRALCDVIGRDGTSQHHDSGFAISARAEAARLWFGA